MTTLMTESQTNAQSVRPEWSSDGSKFWFAASDQSRGRRFFICDVKGKTCDLAFDHEKLAAAIRDKSGGKNVSAKRLPIDSLSFTDTPEEIFYTQRGSKTTWRLNLKTYAIRKTRESSSASDKSRLFLPPRRSERRGDSTHIQVENRLKKPVRMIWISESGEQREYDEIAPGESVRQHTYVRHNWLLKSEGRMLGCFTARNDDWLIIDDEAIENVRRLSQRPRRQRSTGRWTRRSFRSPDEKWTAFVRDDNLWLRSAGGTEKQLSKDGTPDNSYRQSARGSSPDVRWSPDSKSLVAMQTTNVTDRVIHFVDSSPRDQLQPRLMSQTYAKPGDERPEIFVHLYAVKDEIREIPVEQKLMANPWSLRFHEWEKDSKRFTLHYNARGHQTLRVIDVDAESGEVRPLIEETSETFLQYSDAGKAVFEDLNEDEILWASERSGWNHLYRYSREKGGLMNAVTEGEWNVKRIADIDRDAEVIWFYAVGLYEDQDPYHEHFCRVNFDGTGFCQLTDGDGTHQTQFEQDRRYLIDRWSRVDQAPVTELRDANTGELVCELLREETAEQFGDRRITERFVAPGRDGKTPIWGIIHWPVDFDPNKKYPVVENIYAGPHDHHVPKSFRTRYRHQHQIADAGMIVVQIDGMGTAWRSKAFHDVCYKNLRDAGFPDRIAWLKAAAKKYPQMDLSRVGIYGGSAGGQNAMAALLWHNDFYKVAVADCGCHDNRMDKIWWNEQWMGWPVDESYAASSNMENAHLLEGKLMLLVGELDRNVDPASTTQVVRQLIRHDKDFEFVLVAGAGHGSAETPWASKKRLRFLAENLGAQ